MSLLILSFTRPLEKEPFCPYVFSSRERDFISSFFGPSVADCELRAFYGDCLSCIEDKATRGWGTSCKRSSPAYEYFVGSLFLLVYGR